MKRYCVEFSYYEGNQLIFTIKWVLSNSKENAKNVLIKQYGHIHVKEIREK